MKKRFEIPACQNCQARVTSIFSDLQNNELTTLSANKCGNMYKKGQVIFYEGTTPTGLFCMSQGLVKLSKINADGKEQIIRLAKGGSVLGHASLLSGTTYAQTATALEDTTVCFIPRSVFMDLVQNKSAMSVRVVELLSHDVQEAESRLLNMAYHTVRERLAETILMLKEFSGLEEDGKTLKTMLSREDIANLVGTATETVIRLLSEFKDDGLIELSGKHISILNSQRLLATANIVD
jgi:CRP/FNR family transcriptional regulator